MFKGPKVSTAIGTKYANVGILFLLAGSGKLCCSTCLAGGPSDVRFRPIIIISEELNQSSTAVANQLVVTPTRVTNEGSCNWVDLLQVSSGRISNSRALSKHLACRVTGIVFVVTVRLRFVLR